MSAAVKLHLLAGFSNLALAGAAGILLGFNKTRGFLPGFPLSVVFGHAHLAVLGWATMIVMGTGYRLLPMVIPAAMPAGRGLVAGGVLMEVGVLGVASCLVMGSALVPLFASLCVASLAVFFGWVVWMLRHRRPVREGVPRLDPPLIQMALAGASLGLACAVGVWLSFQDARESETALRWATAYGVFGLAGFLSQIVVAMQGRLVPLVAAIHAAAAAAERGEDPPPPHELADRGLQAVVCALWAAGVPAVACGLPLERPWIVGTGAWLLLASLPVHALQLYGAVQRARAWGKPPSQA